MFSPLRFPILPKDRLAHALDGMKRVTPREREILQAVLDGETSKQMGRRLNISPRTADIHRTRGLEKLGLEGIPDLLRFAAEVDDERGAKPIASFDFDRAALKGSGKVKLGEILTGVSYSPTLRPECVNVLMTWDRSGSAAGYLVVPECLADQLHWQAMPEPAVTRPLSNALAYGFLLAVGDRRQLCLTGDLAVWDESWGPIPRALPFQGQRPSLRVMRGSH
jgi:DNA-binding CsgD family transcriptional regulator